MNSLIQVPRAKVTTTGAQFDEALPFEEWAAIGKQIIRASECVQWLIGDWLNFGWTRYVESAKREGPIFKTKYKVALESLPYQYSSLRDFSWVSKAVSMSRRRDKLSWGHHREVASLDAKEQAKYLDVAEKERLSVADLRQLIRANQAEVKDSDGPDSRPGALEWANKLGLWCSQQDPTGWSPERRRIVRDDLKPVVEFYARL